jgi:NTP pyrophosphatase (non-canonical NTP hydrolase)
MSHPGVEHAKRLYAEHSDKLTEWQLATQATAVYPDSFNKELSKLVYCALGLNGEAGEVADEIKKVIRNDGGIITPERREKLKLELGDVGWYWLRAIEEAGMTIEEVMSANIAKLTKRYEHR